MRVCVRVCLFCLLTRYCGRRSAPRRLGSPSAKPLLRSYGSAPATAVAYFHGHVTQTCVLLLRFAISSKHRIPASIKPHCLTTFVHMFLLASIKSFPPCFRKRHPYLIVIVNT